MGRLKINNWFVGGYCRKMKGLVLVLDIETLSIQQNVRVCKNQISFSGCTIVQSSWYKSHNPLSSKFLW